jgi:hypothetical protein
MYLFPLAPACFRHRGNLPPYVIHMPILQLLVNRQQQHLVL